MTRSTTGLSMLRIANKRGENLALTVPADVSRKLVDAGLVGHVFRAELTADGILFVPIAKSQDDAPLPAWARNGEAP